MQSAGNTILFGKFKLPINMMFWNKQYSFAILPCQQIFPGHVLLIPKKVTTDFQSLDNAELFDISLQIKFLTKYLEQYHNATSSTIYVHNYDKNNENSIPHTYVHIIPRKAGDLQNNDEIYQRIAQFDEEFAKKYQLQFSSNNTHAIIEQYGQDSQQLNSFLTKCYQEEYQ